MIRRRRLDQSHSSKTSHDRWLVSYADLVTLLFGFFVVMYSVSHVSEQKYRQLTDTLSTAFSGGLALTPAETPADKTLETEAPEASLSSDQWLAKLDGVLDKEEVQPWVQVQASDQWVEIDIRAQMLFASGSATPSGEAVAVLRELAVAIAGDSPAVEVTGHTDDQPIGNQNFASNWELSAARAAAVARLLAAGGVEPARLSAVGFGEYRPVADNTTSEGRSRNRRVVVRVARPPVAHVPEAEQIPLTAPSPSVVPATQAEPPGPSTNAAKILEPLRLPSGGLLFTNNPEDERRSR